jgi:sugar lactone lactonase YvrE
MNSKAELFCASRSILGEGPFWHRLVGRLFWFDIEQRLLLSANAEGQIQDRFEFDEKASAAGIIDPEHLLIATEVGLKQLTLSDKSLVPVVDIEHDDPNTRSNDGRVHQSGALWIGMMHKSDDEAAGRGSVYHFREGKLERLFGNVAIPNAICFSPDAGTAYFSDTTTGQILKRPVDPATGLPTGDWSIFVDKGDPGHPDGAIIDSEGFLWSARWGGSCIIRYTPDGRVDRTIDVPASQVTCPALGGPGLKTLFATTARRDLTEEQLKSEPEAGGVFAIEVDVPGLPDPLVRP